MAHMGAPSSLGDSISLFMAKQPHLHTWPSPKDPRSRRTYLHKGRVAHLKETTSCFYDEPVTLTSLGTENHFGSSQIEQRVEQRFHICPRGGIEEGS